MSYFDINTAIVVRLENINNEFIKIQDHFSCYAPLGNVNVSKASSLDYRDYYTNKARAIVEKRYKQDLIVLGYTF